MSNAPLTEEAEPSEEVHAEVEGLLALIQGFLGAEELANTRLALITRGAIATDPGQSPGLAAATAVGLIGSAAAEHPGRFVAIDLDGSEASLAALPVALALGAEPRIALRGGELLGGRALRAKAPEAEARPLDPHRTTLITGAAGGLGALLARHLVTGHGARHLLLSSRRGADAPGAKELAVELEAEGASVTLAACDVAEPEAVQALIEGIDPAHPLGAVIHTAGVIEDGLIEGLTPEQLHRVLAPKVDGAWNLHRATKDHQLSHFLLYSSVAGVLGGAGQGNYAAANSFMDALAQQRQAEGLPATAIAWGLWDQGEGGMGATLDRADLARIERMGLAPLSSEQGLELFDAATESPSPLLIAAEVKSASLRSLAEAGMVPALFSSLLRSKPRRATSGSLASKLASLGEQERQELVLELVRTHTAAVLGHSSSSEVEPERPFKDLGFDSLAAVEMRNRLEAASGLSLAATAVFDYPSPAALSTHLLALASDAPAKARVAVRATASEEPIAIVGMSCRYPGGVESPEGLWELLAAGRDGIGAFPGDRGWDLGRLFDPDPDNPGTSYADEGGFMEAAGDFDAEFFSISPREALAMDPQQRLLLEGCWEALEDAGVDPGSLRESATGVFAGVMYQDYGPSAGMTTSVVSGRVAYSLGLEGPAVTVDTACSSSLVAMHLAAQALRSGECSMALAGGVTVLSTPTVFVEFSRQRGLARDGRCKSFDATADGTGWSEGVGMLVLERLADAERNGHPIHAVIKGSAVNQDGASNGLTAPNGPSQERVIAQALANAGLGAAEIDAVEAHGTGTSLGDPIEAGALLATYGQDRGDKGPLYLGSLKSNIGHAQAAAGVGGVIKMVQAMRHGVLPKTLHLSAPSPHVDWEAGEIELLAEAREWKANGAPRRAGVSSFGISGTNAHVILEEGSVVVAQPEGERAPALLPGLIPLSLSAKSPAALAQSAARLLAQLRESPEAELGAVGRALAGDRALLEHRAVAFGPDRDSLLAGLGALASEREAASAIAGRAAAGKLAYLFTGQGSQRVGMGRELYGASPVFAAAFDRVCAELDPHLPSPLRPVVFGEHHEAAALLDRTEFTQPALFALEVALFEAARGAGLAPALLAGHSIGEIAAAHVAGVLDLADACRLIAARGALMGALPAGGGMVAIEAGEEEAAASIAGRAGEISLAAINGPSAVVLSGAGATVAELEAYWSEQGRRTKRLAVSHAFHSPLMEPMLEEFEAVARTLSFAPPRIPILSTLTGELLGDEQATDPGYWVAHARGAVRFAPAVAALAAQGVTAFLELGPDGVLAAMAAGSLGEDSDAVALPLLRGERAEPEAFLSALAAVHVHGARVDWQAFFAGSGAQRVPLPTYPFQRQRYWVDSSLGAADVGAAGLEDAEHPLLGATVSLPDEGLLLSGRLSLATHPWLADHAVFGSALLPGTAFLELALRAGREVGAEQLRELALQAPLVLGEGAVALQVNLSGPDEGGERSLSIRSRVEGGGDEEQGEWVEHASATLSSEAPAATESLGQWPPPGAEPVDLEGLYERLADAGFEYGPAFQGLSAAWKQGTDVFCEVALNEAQQSQASQFGLHPALLDSVLHGALLGDLESVRLPFAWSGVAIERTGADSLRAKLAISEDRLSLVAHSEDGEPVGTIDSLLTREVEASQLRSASAGPRSLFELGWVPIQSEGEAGSIGLLGNLELEGIEAERHADLGSLLTSIAAGAQAPTVLAISTRSAFPAPETGNAPLAEQAEPAEAAHAEAEALLALIGEFLDAEELTGTRLALITRGAIATAPGQTPDLAAATAVGLLGSAAAEHPGRFVAIDLDESEGSLAALPVALALGAEPRIALRGGELLGGRARRAKAPEAEAQPLDPDATTLITGAAGGLGALLARHLVTEHGARHLVLSSRRGPDAPGAKELAAELEAEGAAVTLAACDVAEPEAVAALVNAIDPEHPLGAVIHTAGVIEDGLVEGLSSEQLHRVLAPKVDGAWNLHRATKGHQLSHFFLYSSVAGVLGGAGQGNYAAANSFMDVLAQKRAAEGLPATAIAWGLWDQGEGGMGATLERADLARIERMGLAPLSSTQGLQLFDAATESASPLLIAAEVKSASLRSLAEAGMVPALFSSLLRSKPRRATSGSLATKLASLGEQERQDLVLELVRTHTAAVLGHAAASEVEPERPFKDLGFDSLAAVEMRNRLEAASGLSLAATAVFDYPSPDKLAEHVLDVAAPGGDAGAKIREETIKGALAQLEAELQGLEEDDLLRRSVHTRLRSLMVDLSGPVASEDEVEESQGELESLSTDEIFELIDEELG